MTPVEHPFAPFVRTLGKGKTGSRSLALDEAELAMSMILNGQVEDVQLGAFLMLLRVKEESAEEIAGFVGACRKWIAAHRSQPDDANIVVDLDWSSYAGKRRQPHWFVLSILLLASNGYRVFIHSATGHTAGRLYTEDVFTQLHLPIAKQWQNVQEQLDDTGLSLMPLAALCPPLEQLIQLRSLFGLRSPVHTLCRLLNPLSANATLQSVFHPAYSSIHHRAAILAGEYNSAVFKGDSGEVELRPQANLKVQLLQHGESGNITIPKSIETRNPPGTNIQLLRNVWEHNDCNYYGENAVIGTAAIALMLLDNNRDYATATEKAQALWQQRDKSLLQSFSDSASS